MATYQSAYTGSQIDNNIAQTTPYVYTTALTGNSGTIIDADLVTAMGHKAPLRIPFGGINNKIALYHDSGDSTIFHYIGIHYDAISVANTIYYLDLEVRSGSATTIDWTLSTTEIPIPDTVDNGSLVKVVSGQYALSSGLPYTTTAPSAANTDGLKIVVTSSDPSTKYSGYLYVVAGS